MSKLNINVYQETKDQIEQWAANANMSVSAFLVQAAKASANAMFPSSKALPKEDFASLDLLEKIAQDMPPMVNPFYETGEFHSWLTTKKEASNYVFKRLVKRNLIKHNESTGLWHAVAK